MIPAIILAALVAAPAVHVLDRVAEDHQAQLEAREAVNDPAVHDPTESGV